MGDSRSKPEIFKAISDQVNQLNPDLILSVGDLVGSGGYYNEWEKYYFGVAGDVINHIPMISALGDHEGDSDDGELFTHFLFPHKDYHKLWFSFDYEDAHFIALDYRHPYNEEMIEWFKKDMTASKAKWKFVTMHRPSYNLGGHRSNWGREIWPKLFRDYKVDIVFAGHSHIYERFYPTRPLSQSNSWPVTYIKTGGAGAPLYEVVQDPALAFAKSINHFVYISLNKNQLDLKTYLMDGTILDKISFSKREKEYEESYSSLIKPQENLDLYGLFAGQISQDLDRLPMKKRSAVLELNLNTTIVDENIDFEISLTDETIKSYQLDAVGGTLKKGETLKISLNIYAKKTMIVT